MHDTQNRVVPGLEFRVFCSRPFSRREADLFFASSATVPACLGFTRGGHARWPATGLVRSAQAQKYAKPAKRRHVSPIIAVPFQNTTIV